MILIFLVLETILILVSIYFKNNFFLNSQLAFIATIFIILMNFRVYKKKMSQILSNDELVKNLKRFDENEEKRLEDDKFDELDKFDDKIDDFEFKQDKKLKRAIKFSSSMRAFSPFKFLGYIFLILSFLFLNKNEIFNILAFVFGIFLAQFGVIFVARSLNDK